MKILFIGDSHCDGNFIHQAFNLAESLQLDQIVQVGDFGYWVGTYAAGDTFVVHIQEDIDRTGIPLYWLAGNHENWAAIDRLIEENGREEFISIGDRFFYIPSGLTWFWDNLRFGCLGGAYSIDKHRRLEGYDWFPQEMPDEKLINRIGLVDVLLTHEAPVVPPLIWATKHFVSIPESKYSQNVIYKALMLCKPQLLIHGHWHHYERYGCHGTTVQALDCNYTNLKYSSCILDTELKMLYSLEEFMYGAEGELLS